MARLSEWRCAVTNPYKAVCFLAGILIASVPLTLAQGTYTQIDVPGSAQTVSYGINFGGDISGWYVDARNNFHGFLLSGGTYTTIDYPGSDFTAFYGINNLSQVVGVAYTT